MKKRNLLILALALAAGPRVAPAQQTGKVIDLNKPVNASVQPDGFYWPFDDGLVGESEPLLIQDMSGNGFNGRISKGAASVTPTYAEGVFGTGIYTQGFSDITWRGGHKQDETSDSAKLLMRGQAFTGGVWFKMDDRKPNAHILIRCDDNAIGWRLAVVKEGKDDQESEGGSWLLNFQYGDSRDRGQSRASTSAFADEEWHHVGFSVSPEADGRTFAVVYWVDGEILDTVSFLATIPEPDPDRRFLSVGTGVWGLLDDAFVTTGVCDFKK